MSEEEVQGGKKKGRKRRIFYLLLALLLLLIFLLQLPPVQNYLADRIAQSLSDRLEANVSTDKVHVSLTKGVEIESFLLAEGQDSIIYVEALEVSLASSLWSMVSNRLDLNEIYLRGGRAHIHTARGQSQNNLAILLAKLSQPKEEPNAGQPIFLDLRKVHLADFGVRISNDNSGTDQRLAIHDGYLEISKLDMEQNDFVIKELRLDRPVIRITKNHEGYEVDSSIPEVQPTPAPSSTDTLAPRPLLAEMGQLTITNGLFAYRDLTKPAQDRPGLNYADFHFDQLDVDMQNLKFQDGFNLSLDLKDFSFVDDKGFVLEHIRSDSIRFTNREISLPYFDLLTEKSQLSRSISFRYRSLEDFKRFADRVIIQAELDGSRLAFSDLVHFVAPIGHNAFFAKNKNRIAHIDGKFTGRVNNLKGRNVSIQLDDGLRMKGTFSTRNITDSEDALINFGLERLQTDFAFLEQIIPGFNPPPNFRNLGDINFRGRYDGYLQDFVAFGQLDSEIGRANVDMRLDLKEGTEKANYSGAISLTDFDLGAWSNSPDMGKITASTWVDNGYSLKLGSAKADLNANVSSFTFRDYTYQDFKMDGLLQDRAFEGLFSIDQPEVSFSFDGKAEVRDRVARLDFKADIDKLDLQALNFVRKPWTLDGKVAINTYGLGINTFEGTVLASDFNILKADSLYHFDTVAIHAETRGSQRDLKLFSDIVDAEIEGQFKVEKIPDIAKKILKKSYPLTTAGWTYDRSIDTLSQNLAYQIDVADSKNLFDLIGVPGLVIKKFKSRGKLDTRLHEINAAVSLGSLKIKNNEFYNSRIDISSMSDEGSLLVTIDSSKAAGLTFNPIELKTRMLGDSVLFALQTDDIIDSLERININGRIDPHPRGYRLNINEDEWNMLGTDWVFNKDNNVVFGDKYLNIENFSMSDGQRTINIFDINEKGIQVELDNFDFKLIDGFINYDKIAFSGPGDVFVSVDNIFAKDPSGMVNVSVPNLYLNEESYGSLEVTALKGEGKTVKANIALLRDSMNVLVAGKYDLDSKTIDANAKLRYFPMDIFEYIIGDGVSDIAGTANADARLTGPASDLQLDGNAVINNTQVTIDYLQNTFYIDKQSVKVTENIIDATGRYITDREGNKAFLTGGLKHDMFTQIIQDLVIETDNGIILDTKRTDNPMYYGFAKGKMRAEFSGFFDATNLRITATTGPGTELNIPVGAVAQGYDESFIKFVNREDLFKTQSEVIREKFEIKGLDIEMQLSLTPDAKVSIIFNEALGDIVVGYGNGDLSVKVGRSGDFSIFGEYEIERGEYLFTALGVVAKSFVVDRGGLIKWTGDPVNATLDIKGNYIVDAPVQPFISEYLFDDQLITLASNKTPVALKLDLGGQLYKPTVNFDFEFPELTGELRAYADNKIRTLRENEIALNSQVVGLLAFQTFLPDNNLGNGLGGSFLGNAGVSTISEFVSSQLSRLFTGMFEAALTENGLIAGIDFDIGLVKNNSVFQPNTSIAPDEIEINLKNRFRFLGERLSLNLGGNYVRQSILSNSFFGLDFAIEYYLTEDKKIKLRMYGKSDVDQFIENGRREQYGFGIGYRTEFGTLADFQKDLKKSIKAAIDEEQ